MNSNDEQAQIHWYGHRFYTSQPMPPMPEELTIEAYPEELQGYYFVQFDGPVSKGMKEGVTEAGGELLEYVPSNTYIVRMDETARTRIQTLPYVQWIGIYQPAMKLSHRLLNRPSGEEPKVRKPPTRLVLNTRERPVIEKPSPPVLTVQVFRGEDLQAIQQAIVEAGGEILAAIEGKRRHMLRVRIAEEGIYELAQINGVMHIEEYIPPEIHNDTSREVMNVAPVWETRGLRGSGQIVAIADTGIDKGINDETMHPDLQGRILDIFLWEYSEAEERIYGKATKADYDGHGTHVAGSAVGDGTASGGKYAGVAPEASLVFQALGGVGGVELPGTPDDLSELFDQAYNAGARIHSNSWGSGRWGDYTDSSYQVDEFVWDHPDMLILFAAGNDGWDLDLSNTIDRKSLAAPATAKNALAVGASENNRPEITETYRSDPIEPTYGSKIDQDRMADNPSGMAAFSSRGPTVDGLRFERIKPDLVAPGTMVVSLRTQAVPAYNIHFWENFERGVGRWTAIGLLFSVGLEYQADLEAGELSEAFRQQFESHGITLSDDLTIETQVESYKWQIKENDTGRTFTVFRQDEALKIYAKGGWTLVGNAHGGNKCLRSNPDDKFKKGAEARLDSPYIPLNEVGKPIFRFWCRYDLPDVSSENPRYTGDEWALYVNEVKEKVLFGVGSEFEDDLEAGELSPDFRKEFEDHDIKLSDRLDIMPHWQNDKWYIKDYGTGRRYVASRSGIWLDISEETEDWGFVQYYTGVQDEWEMWKYRIDEYHITPYFRVGFRLRANENDVTGQGFFIDDVSIVDWSVGRAQLSDYGLAGWTSPEEKMYVLMNGTSMATPLTAGAAALVRQYYTEVCGLEQPSAALLRATLINGAREMYPGQYGPGVEMLEKPNWHEGWGRVDVQNSLFPPKPAHLDFVDDRRGLNHEESHECYLWVTDYSVPVVVTMVYHDYPGFGLVNQLHLTVTPPGGGDPIHPNGLGRPDVDNNVQQVVIQEPEVGHYIIRVEGASVQEAPQPFALVTSAGGKIYPDLGSPVLSITPRELLDFGDVAVNYLSREQIQVYNAGRQTLDVKLVGVETNEEFFIRAPGGETGMTLAPRKKKDIIVEFLPSEVGEEYRGELTFESNDPEKPQVEIDLQGRGMPWLWAQQKGEPWGWPRPQELTGYINLNEWGTLTADIWNIANVPLPPSDWGESVPPLLREKPRIWGDLFPSEPEKTFAFLIDQVSVDVQEAQAEFKAVTTPEVPFLLKPRESFGLKVDARPTELGWQNASVEILCVWKPEDHTPLPWLPDLPWEKEVTWLFKLPVRVKGT